MAGFSSCKALRRLLLCCAFGVVTILGGCHRTPREIHSVAELRRLGFDDLRNQVVVRIRGYITMSNRGWNVMILQDEAGDGARLESTDFSVPVDQLVEVTGFAAASGNTPAIAKPKVTWLSSQKPPQPRRIQLSQILDPSLQYARVVVPGVIRSTVMDLSNRTSALVKFGDTTVHVRALNHFADDPDSLVDDDVQLTGVVEASYDVYGKPTNPTLWVSRVGGIVKERTAPPIYTLPVRTIAELARYAVGTLPRHRIRLQGRVFTDASGAKIFLNDGTGELPLTLAPLNPLCTGNGVDAVGFLMRKDGKLVLDDAAVSRFSQSGPSATHLRELTTVAQLHELMPAVAAREYPVHIHGVLTYFDPKSALLFIQDATGGTFVEAQDLANEHLRARRARRHNGNQRRRYLRSRNRSSSCACELEWGTCPRHTAGIPTICSPADWTAIGCGRKAWFNPSAGRLCILCCISKPAFTAST